LARFLGTFAGQEGLFGSNPLGASYLLSRTDQEWKPTALSPPVATAPYSELVDADSRLQRSVWILAGTPNFTKSVGSFYVRSDDGGWRRIGPVSPNPLVPVNVQYLGSNDGLNRIVFALHAGDGQLWPGDESFAAVNGFSLYEYRGDGADEPTLVGIKGDGPTAGTDPVNEGAEMITQCGTKLGSGTDTSGAISTEGYVVFFTAAAGGCTRVNANGEVEVGAGPPVEELYARTDSDRTLAISEPPLTVPGRSCTGICRESQEEMNGHVRSKGAFAGASADGGRVYFITSQPLVDADTDQGPDLYMEELSGSEITGLTMVSEGGSGDPDPGSGAEVQGMSQVTPDGGSAYFVARGLLIGRANANGETAQAGEPNLYRFDVRQGSLSFVARLAASDSQNWSSFNFRPVQSSPSGRFLVFLSRNHLAGTGDESGDGTNIAQLFRYDTATGSIVRVSIGQVGLYPCQESGQVQNGYNCDGNVQDAQYAPSFVPRPFFGQDPASAASSGFIVDDEGDVVFESQAALTPNAANGFPNNVPAVINVYEYRGGNVYLVSDGVEGPLGQTAWGTTELVNVRPAYAGNGAGILFSTQDALVPEDGDSQVSLYMAQAGGGFPGLSVGVGCAADGCQGPSPEVEATAAPGSLTAQGDGNVHVKPKHPKHKQKKQSKKKHQKQSKKKHQKSRKDRVRPGRSAARREQGARDRDAMRLGAQAAQRIDAAIGVGR